MTHPRLASSICLSVAALLIQPGFDHSQAVEAPLSLTAREEAKTVDRLPEVQVPHVRKPLLDRSGRTELGKASFYAAKYDQRTMADGRRFSVAGESAASKSLPLGTVAKVVSLESGKSAVVKVEDRGPYVGDLLLDVSPKVAERLDMKKAGVATVLVKPIAVPQLGGRIKLGAGADDVSLQQIQQAVRTAEELAHAPRHRRRARDAGDHSSTL